jgi:hypothetical protein
VKVFTGNDAREPATTYARARFGLFDEITPSPVTLARRMRCPCWNRRRYGVRAASNGGRAPQPRPNAHWR